MWILISVFVGMCVFAVTTANKAQKEKDRREELEFCIEISKLERGK